MAQMNLTPLDDVLDKHFGKVGTPKRDAFESDVDEALHAYRLGEAIKKARIEQNLTQEQLGERIGVKRAQISRLERGYSITIPTMRRVFKALGVVTATIDLGIAGKVALWIKSNYLWYKNDRKDNRPHYIKAARCFKYRALRRVMPY